MITPARRRFLDFVEAQMGKPSLWAAKGPDAYDCSGLVTAGIAYAGGADLRATHNANRLAGATRPLLPTEQPIPGDLIFFDAEHDGIDEHVGIVRDGVTAIDAAGATSKITTLAAARAQPSARVRRQLGHRYRASFRAIHRNTLLDDIDAVSQ